MNGKSRTNTYTACLNFFPERRIIKSYIAGINSYSANDFILSTFVSNLASETYIRCALI